MNLSSNSGNSANLRMARTLLDSRRKMVQGQLDEARNFGRYSQLSGYAGMLEAIDESLALMDSLQSDEQVASAGHTLVSTFMRRQVECDTARDDALQAERIHEVSMYDGRGTGFLMALRIAQDEFQPARKNPAAAQRGRRNAS